jgi:hypothetical protein
MESSIQQSPSRLAANDYLLLRFFEQYYWTHGRFPTYEQVLEAAEQDKELSGPSGALAPLSGLSKDDWQKVTLSSTFVNSLVNRNMPPSDTALLLSEEQITVANVMLDLHDKRSKLKKLTELGITTAQYNSWLKLPAYRAYCLQRAEDLLEQAQPQAHLSLIGNVERGDLGSIKYFNALTGRYREVSSGQPSVNVEVTNTTTSYGQDVLVQVVEIIQRHVKDTAVLDAIASDILELTRGKATIKGVSA